MENCVEFRMILGDDKEFSLFLFPPTPPPPRESLVASGAGEQEVSGSTCLQAWTAPAAPEGSTPSSGTTSASKRENTSAAAGRFDAL